MEYVNGFSRQLSRSGLTGPAERTIVEPWLSELTRLPLNTYADEPPCARPAALPRRVRTTARADRPVHA
ncbi:hypothetical protein DZF91_30400 [Actinomadura logoneensis]|uniref:Uncharacterized protein n=1 Tax=Actinomadura logoneensis TaxID=2293572 RepID=A0A372JD35_9ACTN|nr:hypothetical protein [Actinomadura logoneensis]RFU37921.1 hypothetical protein DZF91_30400 [Actinomadura logoneensis]